MYYNKSIIVYFSLSNNTRQIAEYIQEQTEAEIIQIVPITPYPLAFHDTIDEMSRQNKNKLLPSIQNIVLDFQDYDTIYLGYPVWDSRLPPVLRTFLKGNDFMGKTIIPFNTHKGFGTGKSVNEIRDYASGAKVQNALSIEENAIKVAAETVTNWLSKLGA